MTQTRISEGQSLVDVSIQELGTVAALFDLADEAGLAITDPITPGQVLLVPESQWVLSEMTTYFRRRGQRINTGGLMVPAPLPAAHDFDFPDFDSSDFDS